MTGMFRPRKGVVVGGIISVEGGKDFLLGLAQGRSPGNIAYYVTGVLKFKTIPLLTNKLLSDDEY
jgi:hypothetical protein